MFERFTKPARAVVIGAQSHARQLGHRRIGTEHLLLALTSDGGGATDLLGEAGVTTQRVQTAIERELASNDQALSDEDAAALRAIGVDLDEVKSRLEEHFGPVPLAPPPEPEKSWFGLRRRYVARGEPRGGYIPFSPLAKKVLELSLREALRLKQNFIGPEHILLGLLRDNAGLGAKVLAEAGVDVDDLRRRAETTVRAVA